MAGFQDVDNVRETLQDCDYDVDATIATLLQTLDLGADTYGQFVCLSVCLSLCMFACLSVCLSVCVCMLCMSECVCVCVLYVR